jgi:hypothetical protein
MALGSKDRLHQMAIKDLDFCRNIAGSGRTDVHHRKSNCVIAIEHLKAVKPFADNVDEALQANLVR